MSNQTEKFLTEFAKLNPSGIIELFILDATDIGGEKLYFYDGTGVTSRPEIPNPVITFQGQAYQPMPVQVKGFELKTQGELPRPTVTFSNVLGTFTALTLLYDDLIGAKLLRKRTLRKFLDDGTEPTPDAELPIDVYFFNKKTTQNKMQVAFELVTSLEIDGLKLPSRQVRSNICGWNYRSPECGVAVNYAVADTNNIQLPDVEPLTLFTGAYDSSKVYSKGQSVFSVQTNGDEWYYKYVANVPASGQALTNVAYWKLVQRYRGEWKAQTSTGVDITYFTYDVVYTVNRGVKQFYLFIASQAKGTDSQPPNSALWVPDRCGKLISSCKLRQDPLLLNLPLTFGGFPGTETVPDVS